MSETNTELHEDLTPPEDIVVATGDEENPVASVNQADALKAIYQKGRKNRELVTREDEEENVDAKMVAKMVEESQDEGEFEHAQTDAVDMDTRPDRMTEPEATEATDDEEEALAEALEDTEYVESPPDHTEEPEPEPEPEGEKTTVVAEKQQTELDYEVNDGKVTVKIEGIEYFVPEADIVSAGGKKQYQQIRAANQRFEKAATYGKALQKERAEFERQQHESPAKGEPPEKGVLSKAELVKSFRERVLDAALDGTEADVDGILEEALSSAKEPSTQDSPDGDTTISVSDQVVEDFEAGYKLDRANANRMLADDYSDIMANEDLRKIASQKYNELDADPSNFGRTAVEMAREAGNFVRKLTNSSGKQTNSQADEMQIRREKKRVLPQQSSARTKAVPPEPNKPRSSRQFIRDLRRKQGNR